MTTTFDIHGAVGPLAELIAHARAGNEIVLVDGDQPVARLTPEQSPPGERQGGWFRGKIWIADDFDAPLPDSFWLGEE